MTTPKQDAFLEMSLRTSLKMLAMPLVVARPKLFQEMIRLKW
jgi:hypothetical protein